MRFYQLQTGVMWISCIFETLPWPTRAGQPGLAWKNTAYALNGQLCSKINLLRQASSCELAGISVVLSAAWGNSNSRGVAGCVKYFHLWEVVICNSPPLYLTACLSPAPTGVFETGPMVPTTSAGRWSRCHVEATMELVALKHWWQDVAVPQAVALWQHWL